MEDQRIDLEQFMQNKSYIEEIIKENKSFQNYKAIGFDADHCLLRYNIPILQKMLYDSFTKYLVEKTDIANFIPSHTTAKDFFYNMGEKELYFGMNYTLIDRNHNTFLKLGKGKVIVKAYKGFSEISVEQIQQIYGKDMRIEYDEMKAKWDKRYFLINGFYDAIFAVIYAQIYEFFQLIPDKKNISGVEIWENYLLKTLLGNYAHNNEHEVFSIKNFGYFFPEATRRIQEIIIKQDQMKRVLQKMKQEGIFLFIVTNSHYEFLNNNMSVAYGQDWQDLFDVIVIFGGKPGFFMKENKSYELDLNQKNKKSTTEINLTENIDLSKNKIFVEGNYRLIDTILAQTYGEDKKNRKVAFFGDNYVGDCQFVDINTDWDSYFIIEEILEEQYLVQQNSLQKSKNLYNYWQWWGSYFYHKCPVSKQIQPSHWHDYVKKSCRGGVIGQLDSNLMLKQFWKIQ